MVDIIFYILLFIIVSFLEKKYLKTKEIYINYIKEKNLYKIDFNYNLLYNILLKIVFVIKIFIILFILINIYLIWFN